MITLADLQVSSLGPCRYDSPLASYVADRQTNEYYVSEGDRVLYDDTIDLLERRAEPVERSPSFEPGGPRARIFHDPATTHVGVVTCGGLCPGLNDVIRAVTLELYTHYGVTQVTGFQNGYAGLVPQLGFEPVSLTPGLVGSINKRGGTVLGTSRGAQDPSVIVDRLVELEIDALIVIGGDGSMHGAHKIVEEIGRRGLAIGVVGIPKTIDNDIPHIGQSFGFATAFSEASKAITAAHVEAESAYNGVGLVKVMGRHAGFIACYAALANHDADFVLIPEVPFALDGENGLLRTLARRVRAHGSAVVVLAEGAGQELMPATGKSDASGNRRLGDIAAVVRAAIEKDFHDRGEPLTLKYLDPGYGIRAVPADAADSVYCARLAQIAVHAAMSGRTDMVVGRRRHRFVHVPIPLVIERRHSVAPDGDLWLSVLESTAQPLDMS
ncbi:ATP-dependent 6-phosphofructokinase [Mumia sp. zg.B53]|uniref:ATP-dependent 6-phosphofructokinase n=1 Tax=unclassified Mumia TaxID=2621872 RepID=UPI001C6E18DE|nr:MULTISPECIES: ATP-dependent 6-phosphofructokinase [unclassified Mumia]MBW9204328.1 ATP-dependent 6-phosphofructokinase [Mumia sp. zg.B17]MBW9209687.1 ATP-dependent 6-phosphofructokinase [Mumia sp. zg.B21]MBW9214291.1 ATP-dependent 6-phosphofructokinase [Mumia sp. zg.B53]MDD9348010.1 ATP-dependent 6-phosphofructokinase [Mumia sp.]